MLSNFYTLYHVALYLNRFCSSHGISELYSQQRDQLCIGVDTSPETTIIISCEPSLNYIYSHDGLKRAKKNSVNLLNSAVGKKICSVQCDPQDRTIYINLNEGMRLQAEMFSSRANVLLCREVGGQVEVLDAFLRKKGVRRNLRETEVHGEAGEIWTEAAFVESLQRYGDMEIYQVLKKSQPKLGSTLVHEILFRSELYPSARVDAVSGGEIGRIYREMTALVAEITKSAAIEPRIYFEETVPICFSLVPLKMYDAYAVEDFSDICIAIHKFVVRAKGAALFTKKKKNLLEWIGKEDQKVRQTLSKLVKEKETFDRATEYERSATLVMMNLHNLRKGMKTARVDDTLSQTPGAETILLDPALTPLQNAERYFQKAKKARGAKDEVIQRQQTLAQRSFLLKTLRDELAEIYSLEELRQFQHERAFEFKLAGFVTREEQKLLPPFRIFKVEGGFQVLAGKNSENNDLLTMKYAKPNDLWFHSRGSGGSHVVLKVSSAKGEPSKKAIVQAASIAAYYSKMKNASTVPVAMTQKKYVRKPKKAPAGSVIVEREKILFVEPKLPDLKRQNPEGMHG